MSQSCSRCPALQAQVTQLRQQVTALQHRVEILHARLGGLIGGVRATTELITSELAHPTMAWRQLLPAIAARLSYLLERAEGRRGQ